jgi:hypothetical protein
VPQDWMAYNALAIPAAISARADELVAAPGTIALARGIARGMTDSAAKSGLAR